MKKRKCPECQKESITYFNTIRADFAICPNCEETFLVERANLKSFLSFLGSGLLIILGSLFFAPLFLKNQLYIIVLGALIMGLFDYIGFLKVIKLVEFPPLPKNFTKPYNKNNFTFLLKELQQGEDDFFIIFGNDQKTYLDILYEEKSFYINLSETNKRQRAKSKIFEQTSVKLNLKCTAEYQNNVDYLEVNISNNIETATKIIFIFVDSVFQDGEKNLVNVWVPE